MSLELRRESPDDAAAVRDVVTRAFDTDPVVADLWDALRERGSIGIVAVDDDGSVCGHVGLTWCWLDAPDRLVDVLVLSPLSVAPEAQRHGHARALLTAARATAEELGSPLLFLERPVDRGPQTVGDEVERRAPVHRQRRPRVVREHGTVNLSNPRAIFAGSPPRFTSSRVTYEAYVVSRTSTRPQVDSAHVRGVESVALHKISREATCRGAVP